MGYRCIFNGRNFGSVSIENRSLDCRNTRSHDTFEWKTKL